MFDNINSRSILDQVPATLKGDPARSLWRRLESEFSSGGTGTAGSYLTSQFEEIGTRLRAALAAAKASSDSGR